MPSPFPGMNPYLERPSMWSDFHLSMLVAMRAALASKTGSAYSVHIESRNCFLQAALDAKKWRYLKICDVDSREVVTVVEVVSPSNKNGDREQYLAKRREVLASSTHFVDIDLLRGGNRTSLPDDAPASDYYVLVARADDRTKMGFRPFDLCDPLPTIPIPLRGAAAAVSLELRTVSDRVYDEAGYAKYLYAAGPTPPLSPRDAEWARRFAPPQ